MSRFWILSGPNAGAAFPQGACKWLRPFISSVGFMALVRITRHPECTWDRRDEFLLDRKSHPASCHPLPAFSGRLVNDGWMACFDLCVESAERRTIQGESKFYDAGYTQELKGAHGLPV